MKLKGQQTTVVYTDDKSQLSSVKTFAKSTRLNAFFEGRPPATFSPLVGKTACHVWWYGDRNVKYFSFQMI